MLYDFVIIEFKQRFMQTENHYDVSLIWESEHKDLMNSTEIIMNAQSGRESALRVTHEIEKACLIFHSIKSKMDSQTR